MKPNITPSEMAARWQARVAFMARKFKAHVNGKVCNDINCSCHNKELYDRQRRDDEKAN